MSKISLIIEREYLTRVRKKSFIIMSILGPILFAAMMVIPAWLASLEDDETKIIAVIDETGLYSEQISDTPLLKFEFLNNQNEQEVRQNFSESGYYAFLVISDNLLEKPDAISLYSDSQITMDVKDHVRRSLIQYLKESKLTSYDISGLDKIIDDLENIDLKISTVKIGDDGTEKQSSAELTMIISMAFAFISYMFIFIYGAQVMRGVMEEKTSRIVEVIVSSVKPFQLMMGKIIGLALVALTQILLWVVLTMLIVTGVKSVFFNDSPLPDASRPQTELLQNLENSDQVTTPTSKELQFNNIMEMIKSLEPGKTLLLFLFYFFGGYLLYSALFAAIGGAIDHESDQQQFMLPITIPIIIALYVAMMTFRNPGSEIAFWFSIIPLTSPIVMMARVPFEVPLWELLLSMFLLVAGFIFTTWLAGKIYRTGILMYGKKVDYKEIWKWIRYSD
ncbi:ABC transporter permease [Thermophagus xiamenensis]|uniref:ABC-2 type transport system permease protein n=1 Tax=Thermophagus xiamenensis TaxID=385682 RepID=A0A1I1UGD6_9BACT|nr:ABC transporter permease [Thermophagus xiamenensis]SFD69665.1 ABC-2 type transport system permease protein [Thermophagus xiamenensis]